MTGGLEQNRPQKKFEKPLPRAIDEKTGEVLTPEELKRRAEAKLDTPQSWREQE